MSWIRKLRLSKRARESWRQSLRLDVEELRNDAAELMAQEELAEMMLNDGMRLPAAGRFYGGQGTIHGNEKMDIETFEGKVVAVWFRCAMVPFTQVETNKSRASVMRGSQVPDRMLGIVFAPLTDSERASQAFERAQ